MPSFFLPRAPTHHNFTFDLRFFYELKHKVRLSKTVCGIFYFFFFFSLLLSLKRHNSFQNQNDRKATHSFASRLPDF